MPYRGIAAADQFLQTHRAQLLGFLRATMKGVRYMKKFKAQTIAIVDKYVREADPAIAEFDYNSAVATLTTDGWVPDNLLKADLAVRASMIGLPPDKIPPLEKSELDAAHWVPTP